MTLVKSSHCFHIVVDVFVLNKPSLISGGEDLVDLMLCGHSCFTIKRILSSLMSLSTCIFLLKEFEFGRSCRTGNITMTCSKQRNTLKL